MSNEKFDDGLDNLGPKELAPYAEQDGDVDSGPKPLMRALESRHMQMIAIVSLSSSPLLTKSPKGNTIKE
jgi:amino acid permease